MSIPQPQGFLAVPPAGKGPGVLVLHAWWGLNDTIKAFCTRLAESGFVAFGADLYHGKVADTIPGAEALGGALDMEHVKAEAEVADAASFLNERAGQGDRGIAVVGFSLGAYYSLNLAAAHPEHIRSVVLFYGTDGTMGTDFSNSKADFLGHFAENDVYETQSNVDTLEAALKRAGRPVTFHRYSGTGHWFFEPDRPDAYNPAAAGLAWDRTLAFLKRSPSS
jgi:carboxymethylenebutenolidase